MSFGGSWTILTEAMTSPHARPLRSRGEPRDARRGVSPVPTRPTLRPAPVRAGMRVPRRVYTSPQAQEFTNSEPVIYPQFSEKKCWDYARFVGILFGIILITLVSVVVCGHSCGFWEQVLHTSQLLLQRVR
jgi:hypothetical protein